MRAPNQVKSILLFFTIVFSITAVAQYFYVKLETKNTAFKMLEADAKDLNSSITFDSHNNGIINLEKYSNTLSSASEYYIVLSDGTVLDTKIIDTKNISDDLRVNVINSFLPPVSCPVLKSDSLDRPYSIPYQSQFTSRETWRILAKKLEGGTVILGISEFANPPKNIDEILEKTLKKFKLTLEDAKKIRVADIEEPTNWALIDDAGRLINAYGRIPLKTNAMHVGEAASKIRYEKEVNGVPYIVLYAAVEDIKTHNKVGTMILPKEVGLINEGSDNLRNFSIGISALSFVLFILVTLFQSSKHEKEREVIKEKFQNYFSPQIMEAILNKPELLKLGGQRREVTILFSDIRSFTSLSEKLPPQQLTHMLREYFTEMTEAVYATGGAVDKYIGDAVMAFWGAPIEQTDQADRAVTTALNMIKQLDKLNEKWKGEGLPILDIGIGINLGVATVGNFGSAKQYGYTPIGDAVNVASRLESLNKDFNSHIIISKSTKDQLTISINVKDLGEVQVKGRDKPIRVFEVI